MASSLPFHTAEMVRALIDESRRPDVLVQPDVFVVPTADARTLKWSGITRLILAVEVEVWTPETVFPRSEHEALRWRPAGPLRTSC